MIAPSTSGRAPEGEPVAWRVKGGTEDWIVCRDDYTVQNVVRSYNGDAIVEPLFAAAPIPGTVTEEMVERAIDAYQMTPFSPTKGMRPAIEAALRAALRPAPGEG